jgi:hypothetical protein
VIFLELMYFVYRVFKVQMLDGVSRAGLLALRGLPLLEEFLFNEMTGELVIRDCLELLPHLHIIAHKLTPYPHPLAPRNMQKIGEALSRIEAPCTLQLRHLWLLNIHIALNKVSLPELQVLEFMGEIVMHPWLAGGVPNLTELHVQFFHQEPLLHILGHIGPQLRTLHLTIRHLHRVDSVLQLCPNLSELRMHSTSGAEMSTQLGPDTHLKHLQTFAYTCVDGNFQPGLLLQILRMAPEIRSVNADLCTWFDEDLKALAELAEEGACMRRLEKFMVRCRIHLNQIGLVDKARTSCSINCPQLQVFSMGHLGCAASLQFI